MYGKLTAGLLSRARAVTLSVYGAAVGCLLIGLCLGAPAALAEESSPAAAIAAYAAALNTHNLAAALALFDDNGSATDARGRHFEGRAGLTEFLLGSGFGSLDAQVATQGMHIVANRAVWTYTCSCSSGPTEVRLVVNHDKITVFAVQPPPAVPMPRTSAASRAGLLAQAPAQAGLAALVLAGLAVAVVGMTLALRQTRAPGRRACGHDGRLLAALAHARQRRKPA